MKRLLLAALLCLFLPALAHAQTDVTPGSNTKLAWDHDGVNVERFEIKVDGQVNSTIPFAFEQDGTYEAPFPALTPGIHQLIVAACNIAGCADSDPFLVRVVVVPAKPSNLRIVTGGS